VTFPSIAERLESSKGRQLICPCGIGPSRRWSRPFWNGCCWDGGENRRRSGTGGEGTSQDRSVQDGGCGANGVVLQVGIGIRSVELTMQDFMSIRDRRWVTDRVVNGYFTFLQIVQTVVRRRSGLPFCLRPSSTAALWATTGLKAIQTQASWTFSPRKDGRRSWTRYSTCACQDGN
jgi:hypothetical protein